MNLCFNPSRSSWKGFGFLSIPRDLLELFRIYLIDLLGLEEMHLKFDLFFEPLCVEKVVLD